MGECEDMGGFGRGTAGWLAASLQLLTVMQLTLTEMAALV